MQRPGLFNEINFYPKSILAKEKIFYTYSKIINCSKFITPTRKKNKFPPKKNVWCSRKSMRKRNHFFKRNNILHPPEKANLFPDEIISHFSLKKPKFHRKRISYTTTENPTFQPKKLSYFSEKIRFQKEKISYICPKKTRSFLYLPPPPHPPSPAPLPRKKAICHTKKIEYTSF